MVNKIYAVLKWCIVILFNVLLAIFLYSGYCNVTPSAAGYSAEEREDAIKAAIMWDIEYSEEIEARIVDNLNKLPENVLVGWLDTDCSITVCSDLQKYIVTDDLDVPEGFMPYGRNEVCFYFNGAVASSDICILGTIEAIDYALIHEVGHYVYYEYAEHREAYELPNYEEDHMRFIENECNNNMHYETPKEYFAELFSYTILNGATDEYADTHVIKEIMEDI